MPKALKLSQEDFHDMNENSEGLCKECGEMAVCGYWPNLAERSTGSPGNLSDPRRLL